MKPLKQIRLVVFVSLLASFIANADQIATCAVEPLAAEDGRRQYQYDSFSKDGQFLAIGWDDGGAGKGTYLLNMKTRERIEIDGFNNGATFSPDGRFLVNSIYVENGKTDIARFDLATKKLDVLAQHEAWDWLPSYSPDGTSIVFNSFRTGNSDIYLLDLADQSLKRLTDSDNYEAHAQFSPDGTKVLYHENDGDGDYNIKLLDIATGKKSVLTRAGTEESYGSWSPDGNYIVFASDRYQKPGVTDLFIMTAQGALLRRLTDDTTKDGYPFWSPDGQYIYFNADREPKGIYRIKMRDLIDCETGT